MSDIIQYFKNKKNLINLLILLVTVVGLPLLTDAIRTQKIFFSRAAGEPIVFTGPNVVTLPNNAKALKVNDQGKAVVDLELTSTLGPPAVGGVAQVSPEVEGVQMSFLPRGGLIPEARADHFPNEYYCQGGDVWYSDADEGTDYFWEDCGSGETCVETLTSAFCQTTYSQSSYSTYSQSSYSTYSQSSYNTYSQSSYGGGGTQCSQQASQNDWCDTGADFGEDFLCNSTVPGPFGNGCYLAPCTTQYYTSCWAQGQCSLGFANQICSDPANYGSGATCDPFTDGTRGDGCFGGSGGSGQCPEREFQSCWNEQQSAFGVRYCNPADTPFECSLGLGNQCFDALTGGHQLALDQCPVQFVNSQCRGSIIAGSCTVGGDKLRVEWQVFDPDGVPGGCNIYLAGPDGGTQFISDKCASTEVPSSSGGYATVTTYNGQQPPPDGDYTLFVSNGESSCNNQPVSFKTISCGGTSTGTCSLTANNSTDDLSISAGQTVNWKVTLSGRSPTDTKAYWVETNSLLKTGTPGTPTEGDPNVADGWFLSYTMGAGGSYTKSVKVKEGTTLVCTTNAINLTVTGGDIPGVTMITMNPLSTEANRYRVGQQVRLTVEANSATTHIDEYYINATTFPNPNVNTKPTPEIFNLVQPGVEKLWTIPNNLTPGKYWFVVNAHNRLDGQPSDADDWIEGKDIGCGWDGTIYKNIGTPPGPANLVPFEVNGTISCGDRILAPFWVGVAGGPNPYGSPIPPGGCGNFGICPTNPAICSNNPQCVGGGGCPIAGQVRCANGQCAFQCGGGPGPSATPIPPSQCGVAGVCQYNNTICANNPLCRPPGASPSPVRSPGASASPTPATGVYTTHFRVAEDPIALNTAIWQKYDTEPERITFPFANANPGPKNVWVEYKNNQNPPRTDRRSATITLLGPDPAILGCNLIDITDKSATFNIVGQNFGTDTGTVKSGQTNLSIKHWTPANIQATYTNPPSGISFPVELTNKNGQSTMGTCSSISQLALGAKLFCRQPGKFDVTGVNLSLAEAVAGGKLVREIVTINKEGIVQGLKARIEEGKKYKLGIEAPKSLRRVVDIVGQAGTTNVPNLVLPIGDIFPIPLGDGTINTPDKSEQNREWIISLDAKDRAADLNQDNRVNSVDWACMRFDFGKSDDPEPQPGP